MTSKKTAVLVLSALAVVIVLALVYSSYSGNQGSSQTTTTLAKAHSPLLASESDILAFTSFNGSRSSLNYTSPELFLSINMTAYPLNVSLSNGTLIPTGNLSDLAHKSNPLLNETFFLPNAPLFSKYGLANNASLILYAGQKVGSGDNTAEVFVRTGAWSIYSNGTAYLIDNGSYAVYMFAFANSTEISGVVPYGHSVNSSVVAQGASRFPSQFTSLLNQIRSSAETSFVPDGRWWYAGYFSAKFVPLPLPSSYYSFG